MKKRLLFALLLPLIILIAAAIVIEHEYRRFLNEPINVEGGYTYTIAPGSNLTQISRELSEKGLTDMPPLYLDIYGRVEELAQHIKAGEYLIKPDITLPQLLQQFVEGKTMQYAFTIVEGMTAKELLQAVRQHPKIKTIEPEVELSELMQVLGSEETDAEGWFLPETYHFPANTTDIEFLQRAYQQMQKQLAQAWQQKSDKLPYKTAYDVLIMASIIEKETGIAEERPQIAGVFVRRLQKGMRLQTDPTVIYGMGDEFDGNLRRKDLQTDTPYNTYTRKGLPPTPICLPSIESIQAALNPAEGDSLYFVATGEDGRHVFSSNLKDHNNAVRRYQLKQK